MVSIYFNEMNLKLDKKNWKHSDPQEEINLEPVFSQKNALVFFLLLD